MTIKLDKEKIFSAFLTDSEEMFKRALGPQVTREAVASFFEIPHFFDVVEQSAHWATWRAVGIEHRLAGGDVDRHIGFDVKVGNDEMAVIMRYFPNLRGKNSGDFSQLQSLYVHRIPRESTETNQIYNIPAKINRAMIDGRNIIFRGSIPIAGRAYRELSLFESPGERNHYSFRFAESTSATRYQRVSRKGPYNLTLL